MNYKKRIRQLEQELEDKEMDYFMLESKFSHFKINLILIIVIILFTTIMLGIAHEQTKKQKINEMIKNPPKEIKDYCVGKLDHLTEEQITHFYRTQGDYLYYQSEKYHQCIKDQVKIEVNK